MSQFGLAWNGNKMRTSTVPTHHSCTLVRPSLKSDCEKVYSSVNQMSGLLIGAFYGVQTAVDGFNALHVDKREAKFAAWSQLRIPSRSVDLCTV